MAGDIPNLNVEILVQLSNLTAAVNEATAGLNKIGNTAKEQEPKFGQLKSTMAGVFAGNLLTAGLGKLEEGLKGVVEAASQAQTTTVALATAMNNAKVNTEANRSAVEKSVTSMENLAFTGNDARGAMMTLVTATGSVTKSTELMGLASNLARAQHESLGAAAETLAKATAGKLGGAFKEYGITLDTTLPKNQAITKAFNELNEKIKNQASAYLDTYAGKMELLKTKMDKAKETIGGALIPVLTSLTGVFAKVLDVIKPILPELTIIAATIGTVIIAVKAWEMAQKALDIVLDANPVMLTVAAVVALIAVLITVWNHSKGFRVAIVDAMEAGVKAVGWLIGAVGDLVSAFLKFESGPLRAILSVAAALHFPGAKSALNFINDGIKDVGQFFDSTKAKVDKFASGLESLKNQKISIGMSTPDLSKGGTGAAPVIDVAGQAANGNVLKSAAAAAKAHEALVTKNLATLKKLNDQYATDLVNRQDQMDAALQTRRDAEAKALLSFNETKDDLNRRHAEAYASAQKTYDEASANSERVHTEAIKQINADFAAQKADLLKTANENLIAINKQYADNATALEQQAADKRQTIIQSSIDLMTSAFANATKVDIGSLFKTGNTAGDLKTALQDQLTAVVKLQKDAGLLAAQGYSQTFIDQVIAKGPQVGDEMSQAILDATPETAAQLKSLYGQIEKVSDTGLDALAKSMNSGTRLATQQMMDQYNQVGVDLAKSLADNSSKLAIALEKDAVSYDKSFAAATSSYNKSVAAADKTLSDALASELQRLNDAKAAADQTLKDGMATAQRALDDANAASLKAYNDQISAISKAMDDKLTALQGQIKTTLAMLSTLGVAASSQYISDPTSTNKITTTPGLVNGFSGSTAIGTLNQNVYTTDASLPSVTAGTLAAITLGQTQGIIPANKYMPGALNAQSVRAM